MMAVGSVTTGNCFHVAGIRLAAIAANIRYQERLDLVLIEIADGSTVSGVFTQNAFCAAPVTVARNHLAKRSIRFFLINTGNANAGTGKAGEADALSCCREIAALAGNRSWEVLPFSTGIIGEKLPVERIMKNVPNVFHKLTDSNWEAAAQGILTTDTRAKLSSTQVSIGGQLVTITGLAKGAGMIKPEMATMLSFVFTDVRIDQERLDQFLKEAVNLSFNRLTVDGDTSTNDCCMLTATGQSGVTISDLGDEALEVFKEALFGIFQELATNLIRDAEGATKFVTVEVSGGKDEQECLRVAYCVAESPLVKTALFASDPNWGRILAAVGRAGLEDLDIETVTIYLGDTQIVAAGARAPNYKEALGQLEMNQEEIAIRIDLARGSHNERVWTSDLSHDYVRINAEYRT
ncbi:MAG: bifunctional glutamate N-acetyltransferase/amino-acid acetyltransferase ArgJ [Pseudomonadota bacterium]|nr:bifunctional glutamate N-acetyltransferase/amino-acid acetyltransferase ArgJ [Pseudomonadota bacterium]